MTELYSRNGERPAALPSICYDDRNWSYTAPYANEDLAYLGFVFFADVDLSTHQVVADGDGWKVEPIPAPEPEPEPEPVPISMTVGDFVSRFVTPDEDNAFAEIDDAMMAESRLVKRNWQNDRYPFTENDGFWTILKAHASVVLPAARVAEIFGASGTMGALAA